MLCEGCNATAYTVSDDELGFEVVSGVGKHARARPVDDVVGLGAGLNRCGKNKDLDA